MMMKRFRKSAPEETVAPVETPEAVNDPFVVSLGGKNWNLAEETTFTVEEDQEEAVLSTLAHIGKNDTDLIFFAFDLPKTLEAKGIPVSRLALTEHEAWDLSVALVETIQDRKEGKPGQRLIVVVNDHADLLTNENPEDAEQYRQLLGNLETVADEGASFGINLLLV